jgi:hypothetical protein
MKLAHLLLILAAIFLAVCGAPTNLASGAAAPHPLFQTLFQNCKADQTFNSPPASFCLGYVTGVGEMIANEWRLASKSRSG